MALTFLETKRRSSFDRSLLIPHKLVQLFLKRLFFFTQHLLIFSADDRCFMLLYNQMHRYTWTLLMQTFNCLIESELHNYRSNKTSNFITQLYKE